MSSSYTSSCCWAGAGCGAACSPLFALCGSGTTGCHGKFHDGGLRAEWVWRTGAAEEAWWSGTMLREYPPHSPDLYMFGYWAITDRYGNEIIREVK